MKKELLGLPMVLVMAFAVASPARADMPPPEGYVETCTVSRQQTSKTECLECMGMHDQTERCTNLLAPYCYVKVCKTWGTTSFLDVLCRTKDPSAPTVPVEVVSLVNSREYPLPNLPDGGATTAPSNCLPYTPPTPEESGSGCHLPDRDTDCPLWPVLLSLGVLGGFVVRRHTRAR